MVVEFTPKEKESQIYGCPIICRLGHGGGIYTKGEGKSNIWMSNYFAIILMDVQ
jgi:hypothetical protein